MFVNSFLLTLQRLFELLVSAIVLSVVGVLLNITKIASTETILTIFLSILVILFAAINIFLMRNCFVAIADKRLFYVSNILAYIIFAAVTLVVYECASSRVYTWLFAITKFAHFNSLSISTSLSAAIFHIIGIICIFLSPIGLKWALIDDMEDDAEFLEKKIIL